MQQVWNIALDRIASLEINGGKYIPNETDWEKDNFFDLVGVTKTEGEEPIEIKIWVAPGQVPYIRTKPIHGSQKGPTQTAEGWI